MQKKWKITNPGKMSESMLVGILLALVGGYLDAYTYITRGEVFANAQTGNIVLMGIELFQKKPLPALRYLIPILAFFVGIIVSEMVKEKFQDTRKIHWRQIIIVIEMLSLGVVAFLPENCNMAANAVISFVCSLQVGTFRKMNDIPYATTMCTGNLRSATQHLYAFRKTRNKKSLYNSLKYFMVIFFFVLGAGIGAVLSGMWDLKAVLLPCLLLLMVGVLMFETGEDES